MLGDMTREKGPLNKRVESIGVVFTASLRNINQLTATTLKG